MAYYYYYYFRFINITLAYVGGSNADADNESSKKGQPFVAPVSFVPHTLIATS